jgi:hypothetical protein
MATSQDQVRGPAPPLRACRGTAEAKPGRKARSAYGGTVQAREQAPVSLSLPHTLRSAVVIAAVGATLPAGVPAGRRRRSRNARPMQRAARRQIGGVTIRAPRCPARALRNGGGEAGAQGALGAGDGTARLGGNPPLRSAAQSS